MKENRTAYIVLGLLIVSVLVIGLWMSSTASEVEHLKTSVGEFSDSVQTLLATLDSLKEQMPGLGDYMSTIQLHTAKLWFAAQAANWELVRFELHELDETIEAAEMLHATKNNVNISSVLQSMRETQLFQMSQASDEKDLNAFKRIYGQTIEACNGCHRPAGYAFIHITHPSAPPVMNQSWRVVQQEK